MKLTLNDVVRVKEDMQFHYTMIDKIVGETFKVTTIINDDSILVQRCTENGALTHSETKRVRNPDMNWVELTDYYDILKTDDQDKLDCGHGETILVESNTISEATIADFIVRFNKADPPSVQSGGVWYGPNHIGDWPTMPDTIWPQFDGGGLKNPSTSTEGSKEEVEEEYSGGSSSYYSVFVEHPTTEGRPQYHAECNDIIESLNMTPAEANVFKATWRRAAARNLGKRKKGYDNGLYDAEKIVFFGGRMVVQSKAEQEKGEG